jgi:hypothetical protein
MVFGDENLIVVLWCTSLLGMLHRCVRGFGVSSEQCQTKLILGTGIFPKWLGSLDSGLSSCISPCQSSTLCPLRRGLPVRLSVASGERRVELHKRVSCKIFPFHALKPLAAVVVRYQKLMLGNSTNRHRFGDTVGASCWPSSLQLRPQIL